MKLDALLILAIFGVPLALWAIGSGVSLYRSIGTTDWIPVPGRVVSTTPSTWYSYMLPITVARIEYRYSFTGKEYSATDIGAGEDNTISISWPPPRGLVAGTEVTAYCDPSNPRRAVLRRGSGFHDWLAFATPVVGIVLLLRWLGLL